MGRTLTLLIAIFCLFVSCIADDESDCPSPAPEIHNLIIDKAGHWFESIAIGKPTYSYSNSGKTESYNIRFTHALRQSSVEDCAIIKNELRRLDYGSSLYQNTFLIEIRRELDADYLRIGKDYWFQDPHIEMNIQHPTSCHVTYEKLYTFEQSSTNLPVIKIDSLILKTCTVYNVFKIDFDSSLYSFNRKTKVLYFNSSNGLIGFETFDGETWYLY